MKVGSGFMNYTHYTELGELLGTLFIIEEK